MAEAADLAVLIIGLSKTALSIITHCIGYMETVKERKQELRRIIAEISLVRGVLDTIQALIRADPSDTAALKALDRENGPIQGCLSALSELKSIFDDGAPQIQQPRDTSGKSRVWQDLRVDYIFGTGTSTDNENMKTSTTTDTETEVGALSTAETFVESARACLITPTESATQAHVATITSTDGRYQFWQHSKLQAKKIGYEIKMAVTWPLKLERIESLRARIALYRQDLELAIQSEVMRPADESRRDTKQMKQVVLEVQGTLCGSELMVYLIMLKLTGDRFKTLRYLPLARGEWLLRTPEWRGWLSRDARFLWLRGIPGAGKTVLASFLFQQLKAEFQHRRKAVCYYYCYFGHNQDETTPFLCWVLSQLCRRAGRIPANINQIRQDGYRPDDNELLLGLENILESFDVAYIVVDAVDESDSRENLIAALVNLVRDTRFDKVQLLATSREYQDIERVFSPIATTIVMAHEEVEKDIRTYVHTALRNRPSPFERWSPSLLEHVEKTLAKEAKGMFHWAYCQTKRLEKVREQSEENIRAILKTLPKDIYETYDRIFLEISEEDKVQARAILVFVAAFTSRWTCYRTRLVWRQGREYEPDPWESILENSILQAYILYESKSIPVDHDPPSLHDLCGCLLRETVKWRYEKEFNGSRDEVHGWEFAHYTVLEYLTSEYLATHRDNRLQSFALSEATIYYEYSMRVLGFALDLQEKALETGQSLEDTISDPIPESTVRLYHAMEDIAPVLQWLDERFPILDDDMRHSLTGQYLTVFDPGPSSIMSRFLPFRVFFFRRPLESDADLFLEFLDMNMFSIQEDCVVTRRSVTTLISLALLRSEMLIESFLEGEDVVGLLEADVFIASSEERQRRWSKFRTDGRTEDWNPQWNYPASSGGLLSAIVSGVWATTRDATDYWCFLLEVMVTFTTRRRQIRRHARPPSRFLYLGGLCIKLLGTYGIDVDASDYAITPLQILVERRLPKAVEEILEKGADPNKTGKVGGKTLRRQTRRWSQASPLHINKELAPFDRDVSSSSLVDDDVLLAIRISSLLESHGGKDFVKVSSAGEEEEH
ncbi:hypothetical protein CONLIGDRAFT_644953 [Coniochaeta ligniaria NRRL 30616]|uniref:Nephrocystin 3-like N-terminal domain-containing protein n=1 Tax=Coniochaeta ligniaria NRRL 30616 TaxID=1408157 RepID=A0A1J7JGE5_9PEZI|nr:hypothetical protein CONLIGDRAFT_644953 [Coniochaeta ligniaria NRRL 30616]